MNKLLLKTFIFLISIWTFASLLNIYFLKYDEYYNFYSWKFDDLNKKNKKSNLLIGSSHGCFGINPKLFKHNSFNFCFTGSNPEFYLNLYKIGVLDPSKIDTLFYQVDWFMFDHKLMWREIQHDGESISTKFSLAALLEPKIKRFELFQHKFFNFNNPLNNLKKTILPDSYFFNYFQGFIQYNIPNQKIWDIPEKVVFDSSQINSFVLLIDNLVKKNIPIILLSTPEFQFENNKNQQKGIQLITQIAERFNIPFIDVLGNPKYNYSKMYFHDWGHLNNLGATKFSQEIGRQL